MDQQETISGILESLEQLQENHRVPESVQVRLDEIEEVLHEDIDVELRKDRIRSIIEQLDELERLPNQARTQLWSINAMLELL